MALTLSLVLTGYGAHRVQAGSPAASGPNPQMALAASLKGRVYSTGSHGEKATSPSALKLTAARIRSHWVSTWGASPQEATPGSLAATGFDNQTVRNIIFTSVGGATVRVRFSNTFGDQPLEIGRAAIGVELSGASVAAGTNRPLLFAGQTAVTIPPGAEALSDPVNLTVAPLQDLVVSIYLPQANGPATQHADAQQVNYVASGDQALSDSGAAFTTQTQSWYLLDDVDVLVPKRVRGTVVALGDSITDGAASTVNTNARWPNDLARRLDAREGSTLSVIDEGISGNRVLNNSPCFGVDALARLDRDVLSQAGVRDVILLEGINDIGFSQTSPTNVYPGVPFPCFLPNIDVSAAQIIAGYQQIIAQAHAEGLKIFGGTLAPFGGAFYWSPAAEAKREAVNGWIRTNGAFDGVIDFDAAVRDPSNPLVLKPAYDSGDHLHPNDAGYQAMATAIDLTMLGARHVSAPSEKE